LRTRIQGVAPPVHRSWEDFDPGAKYHVPSNTPYERYFVASILTFMFHETLCKEAGQFDPKNGKPLHLCSIYGSKAAGKKLADMLSAGSSVHWSVTLDKMTGTNRLDALPLLNYYAPLMEWLKKDNEKNGEDPGWESGRIEDICTEEYQRA
jgi:peptidyl-dipeptidase A